MNSQCSAVLCNCLGLIYHSWSHDSKQLTSEKQSLSSTINVHPSSWSHHLNRSVNNSHSLFCYSIFFVLPFTGHILLLGLTTLNSFFGEEQSLFSCSIFIVLSIAWLIPMLGLIILNSLSVKNSHLLFYNYCSPYCWTHPYVGSHHSEQLVGEDQSLFFAVLHYIYCSPCYRTHPSVGSHHPKQLVSEEQTLFCRGHEWLQVSQKYFFVNLVRLLISK